MVGGCFCAGIAQYDVVTSSHSACYVFKRYSNDQDLKISLTPMSGDPDLYVHNQYDNAIDVCAGAWERGCVCGSL